MLYFICRKVSNIREIQNETTSHFFTFSPFLIGAWMRGWRGCRDIDVRTVVSDKLVEQSSNCDKFGAKFRSPKLRAKA